MIHLLISDLFLHLSLGEGDDMSIDRYTSVITGDVTWVTSAHGGDNPRPNGAIHFTSTNQYLVTSYAQSATTCPFQLQECSEGISITFWINVSPSNITSGYTQFLRISQSVIIVRVHPENNIRLKVRTDTHAWNTAVLPNNGWTHIGLTWALQEGATVFRDGVLWQQDENPGVYSGEQPTADIQLSKPIRADPPFAMDEVSVWTKAKPMAFIEIISQMTSD